jgi:hypothetical protein
MRAKISGCGRSVRKKFEQFRQDLVGAFLREQVSAIAWDNILKRRPFREVSTRS